MQFLVGGTICFPHWKFYFNGYDNPTGIEYWDPRRKMRFVEEADKYIPFDMVIKQDELSWKDMTKGRDCYYFYTSYYGEEEKDILMLDGAVTEDTSFQYKNCVIHRAHFCYE